MKELYTVQSTAIFCLLGFFAPFIVHLGRQKNGFCSHCWMVNTEFYSLVIQNKLVISSS